VIVGSQQQTSGFCLGLPRSLFGVGGVLGARQESKARSLMVGYHRDASDSELGFDFSIRNARNDHPIDLFSCLILAELTRHPSHYPVDYLSIDRTVHLELNV